MKLCSLAALALFGGFAYAQSVPEIPFDGDVNFLKFPADLHLGEPSGVAVNSQKHIFVFNRGNSVGPAYAATAAQLLEFGPDGKFIREIGHNLYAWSFAHDVRVDRNDNIWVIDKGSDMIIKFNPQGRVTMVFGRKKEASDEGAEAWKHPNPPLPAVPGQFRQPTDVAWDRDDNVFISDGYINSRVAKFDKNGKWVKSFGDPGSGPGQFNTPHGIANDAQGNIYVADRGNRRIQVFDPDGKLLREIRINASAPPGLMPWMGNPPDMNAPNNTQKPGAPWTVCISPGPTQYIYTSDAYPGKIYKLTLDGKLIGELGQVGRQAKEFGWIHQIACPSENELYVGEILNWRVQKLSLHPAKVGP
ncbi:MAG TPA: peptidyl-alpha-hydroxyglycine alpha-amidating lyase family protein [Bryobacteraceae bacterium]|nr:peptidyl-alpha-hydroxyglycine alpha-amidating lyase family protein [Bryobacteraceae bacterium]